MDENSSLYPEPVFLIHTLISSYYFISTVLQFYFGFININRLYLPWRHATATSHFPVHAVHISEKLKKILECLDIVRIKIIKWNKCVVSGATLLPIFPLNKNCQFVSLSDIH